MKLYEIYLILKPSLDEAAVNEIVSELGETLAKEGFGISSSSIKPNEHLTHPVQHFKEGHRVDMEITGPEETVLPEETETKIKSNENVLRYLVFAKSERMMKRVKPLPAFDQSRGHKPEERPARGAEAPSQPPTPAPPVDVEEVDRKLEEILK